MKRNFILLALTCTFPLILASAVGSNGIAESPADAKAAAPGGQPELKLPPGWTAADMQACMIAGTPGKMQLHLAKGVGVWDGKCTMWMAPGAEPMKSECTFTVTAVMDGRYTKGEMAGEMPGMGPYRGFGIYGFDNVSEKFVSTWIDNHSTGIMNGTGVLSPDGKTLTWNYVHNCPITKKPTVLQKVDTSTGPNSMTLEMFGEDPKSGKELRPPHQNLWVDYGPNTDFALVLRGLRTILRPTCSMRNGVHFSRGASQSSVPSGSPQAGKKPTTSHNKSH